jgi:tellurite resistance protein TehA-like permease
MREFRPFYISSFFHVLTEDRIQKLGLLAQSLFAQTTGTSSSSSSHSLPAVTGDVLCALGFISALVLWGFGLLWLFLALGAIVHTRKFPFNIGWWGFTFPLGVFAASTCQLGRELGSPFLLVLGTVFSVAVTMLWLGVAARTVVGVVEGKVFYAPCLAESMDN